jgi:competence protein ComEC
VRTPAAFIALPLVFGTACGLLVADHVQPEVSRHAAAAAGVALIAAISAFASAQDLECTLAVVAGTLVAGISLGHSAATRAYHPPLLAAYATADPAAPLEVQGVLREDAARTPTGVSLLIGGTRLSVTGTLALDRFSDWRAGRTVRVMATLREPTTYVDPGVPDERRALARRGIVLVGSIKSGALVEVTARGSPVGERAADIRAWTRSMLSASVGRWSARSAGIATAILIGDRSGLTQDDERRLQEAGTYHVIAISGGNMAILTMIVLGLLRMISVPMRVAAAIAIVVLVGYGQITGSSPSVDRAIAAAVLYLSARLIDHRGPPLNVLAIADALGLATSPVVLFDPGFILSFGATLGILVGVPQLLERLPRRGHASRRVLMPLIAMCAATVAAEIALMPVTAATFGRVTGAGLFLNFVAIPLMTIVQAVSLVTLALAAVHPDAARLSGYVVHVAASGLVESARLVDVVPWLSREVVPPAWWLVGAYYAALIVWRSWRRAQFAAALIALSCALLIMVGPHATARDAVPPPAPGSMRVVVLDVGQGDATMVQLPDGRVVLVDGGGLPAAPAPEAADMPAFDVGERVVARALRAFGVRSLDAMVVTHGDPDHIGGARAIVERFHPGSIWEGVPVAPHVPLQALMSVAVHDGAEWRTVQTGDRVTIAGVDLRVLHPPLPDWERQRVRNDDSIVLALRFGNVTIVLPGDIGAEGESRALRAFEPTPLVILKAPHHGSATSSTEAFLRALNPRVVIFSAGRANRFGHPAPMVVERYRAMGVTMFSTASDGAVVIDTNGETVRMSGWGSGRTSTVRADGLGTKDTMTRWTR